MNKGINRRNFLKSTVVSSTAIAAVASGCSSDPIENLIPNLVPPEDFVPGVAIHYATTCQECSSQCGIVAKTREGRAIKVEGNIHNPVGEGNLCSIGQASLQGLYSPTRIKSPYILDNGSKENITWQKGLEIFSEKLKGLRKKGAGELYYIGTPNPGSLQKLLDQWLKDFGGNKVLFDLNAQKSIAKASTASFGKKGLPTYNIEKASTLVNFGADFLETWQSPLENSKAYAKFHSFKQGEKGRYIHVGPHLSLTGSNADEWLDCAPGDELAVVLALSNTLLSNARHISSIEKLKIKKSISKYSLLSVAKNTGLDEKRIKSLAKAIGTRGNSLIIGGGNTSANKNSTSLQIAINLLNYIAGNIGKTVTFGSKNASDNTLDKIKNLIEKMNQGKVDVLVIHNTNPVYSLPISSGFKEALKKVPYVVSLSTAEDETMAEANLVLPSSHHFESWGDGNPKQGIYSIQQPVMGRVPGYNTVSIGDILIQSAEKAGKKGYNKVTFQDYVKEQWKKVQKKVSNNQSFETFWKTSLQKGGAFKKVRQSSAMFKISSLSKLNIKLKQHKGLTLLPVNSVFHDANGNGGDKPWLLEVPHPLTQVVWDSWIEIHPETAVAHGITHGDLVKVTGNNGYTVEVAAWIYHGISKKAVAMPTGLGRKVKVPSYSSTRGRLAFIPGTTDRPNILKDITVGVNPLNLLPFEIEESGDLIFSSTEIKIESTGKKAYVVMSDGQYRDDIKALRSNSLAGEGDRGQKDRGFIRSIDIKELLSKGHGSSHAGHHLRKRHYTTDKKNNVTFYKDISENVKNHVFDLQGFQTPDFHKEYKWGMTIDLDNCTGCSACVIACYSENNIPVVGKERQSVGREMSWLRIERYFDHDKKTGELETNYSPQMCGQCDNAGCEPVCPVYATYHNNEGLNAMVYNRCVGTRYCANNCVYKQRRFNWRTYEFPSPLHMQLNPEVTVREKGVMEKCTFCVQRVREKKDIAKDHGRQVYDGEIKTACQQTCPTNAISFGNLVDPNSLVIKDREENKKRTYTQLEEANFKPAVTYLKKVKHHKKLV